MNRSLLLYKHNYIDKDFERLELFVLLRERYGIQSALYPGSYVHVTPSFVFPTTVYADTDKRAKKFFDDPWTLNYIEKNKCYTEKPVVRFHTADYRDGLEEKPQSFDLLISQYAGFISRSCKPYLKPGGLLLVNNSHGDASLASMDDGYRFIAAIAVRNGRYRLIETNLDSYFIPKSEIRITTEHLYKTQRGIAYKKTAWAYCFTLGIEIL
jgi:hypothetical protein